MECFLNVMIGILSADNSARIHYDYNHNGSFTFIRLIIRDFFKMLSHMPSWRVHPRGCPIQVVTVWPHYTLICMVMFAIQSCVSTRCNNYDEIYLLPRPHRGRARYCNAHVCLSVCLFVCVFVRVFAKFQSVISQPFLNRSLWHLAYILRMGTPWLTNIFQNFRSKVKVVGRRKVKNVIWPYLGNDSGLVSKCRGI